MSWSPDPHAVIAPTVAMMLNVLNAASRSNSVKRVVATSSVVAAYPRSFDRPVDGDFEVDTGEWLASAIPIQTCKCTY
jgi:nucleoside-diphosphate-sugar epimerase